MGAVLRYTVWRLGFFFVAVGFFYALGARWWLNLGLSAVVALLLSYVLLRRQRNEVAAVLTRALAVHRDETAEDAALDAEAGAGAEHETASGGPGQS